MFELFKEMDDSINNFYKQADDFIEKRKREENAGYNFSKLIEENNIKTFKDEIDNNTLTSEEKSKYQVM